MCGSDEQGTDQGGDERRELRFRFGTDGFVGVDECAALLGLARPSILRLLYSGAIPATKVTSKWRIPLSYIRELEERAYARRQRAVSGASCELCGNPVKRQRKSRAKAAE